MSPAIIAIIVFWIIIIAGLWALMGINKKRILRNEMERVLDFATIKNDMATVKQIQDLKSSVRDASIFSISAKYLHYRTEICKIEYQIRNAS